MYTSRVIAYYSKYDILMLSIRIFARRITIIIPHRQIKYPDVHDSFLRFRIKNEPDCLRNVYDTMT